MDKSEIIEFNLDIAIKGMEVLGKTMQDRERLRHAHKLFEEIMLQMRREQRKK